MKRTTILIRHPKRAVTSALALASSMLARSIRETSNDGGISGMLLSSATAITSEAALPSIITLGITVNTEQKMIDRDAKEAVAGIKCYCSI